MEARQKLERDIVMKKHQIYKKKKDEADLYKNEKNKHVEMARTFREESQRQNQERMLLIREQLEIG